MHIQFDRLDRYTLALLYLADKKREPPLSAAGHDPDAIQRLEQSGYIELDEDSDELELTQDGFARGKDLCLRILDVDDIVDASWREDTWEPPELLNDDPETIKLSERDIQTLCRGLEEHEIAYLDTQTGEVDSFGYLPDNPEFKKQTLKAEGVTPAEKRRQVESDDRYIVIPEETTDEAWQLRRDYCDRIVDDDLHQQLLDNIHGSGAFGRFKDFVSRHPPLRELWFEYRTYRRRLRVLDLLAVKGYIPQIT